MQEFFIQLLQNHPLIAPILYIIARALAIIVPPIPGLLVDVPGILLWGRFVGFIYAEIGIMLGAMVAFWIARIFREPLVRKLVPLQQLREWEAKLSENQKFWTLVAVRLPTNPLFDYISYAAGLTHINATIFFFSTLIGNVPSVFLVYYLGGLSFNKSIYFGATFIAALFIFWLVLRGKKNRLIP